MKSNFMDAVSVKVRNGWLGIKIYNSAKHYSLNGIAEAQNTIRASFAIITQFMLSNKNP